MKFWIKIETFINILLGRMISTMSSFILKLTPKKVKNTINSGTSRYNKTKATAKKSISTKKGKIISSAISAKEKSLKTADLIQNKSVEVIIKAKEVDYKKIQYGKLFVSAVLIFSPLFFKIKAWLVNLTPKFIIGSTFTATAVMLSSITIYTESQKISEKASAASAREPAAEVENATEISKRKSYYKLDEKRFNINNVIMPVYIDQSTDIRTLNIDLTLIASNQYIKNYFSNKRHLIKDKLNSTIEPLVPEFPLEEEGKSIIKQKIKSELNQLLRDLRIKGEIQEVHINSILAG